MLETPHALLACFAAFYERLVAFKLAARKGHLEALLAEPGVAAPANGAELAARVQASLLAFLEQQQREVALGATGSQMQAYRVVLKVMAAVADEAFLLELDWPGREAWLAILLEARLFRTRDAGSFVFDVADRLVRAGTRGALERDVAAVLLFALRLGFQGRLRGTEAQAELQAYRARLSRLAHEGTPGDGHAFPQAYAYCIRAADDARLAPLRPWLRAGGLAAAIFLLASALCWSWTMAGLLGRLGAI